MSAAEIITHLCFNDNMPEHQAIGEGVRVGPGCVVSITRLTCMSQDRCSHQLCQYLYQGLVALLQVEVNAHHPPDCLRCQILVCSRTAEWQPFTKPCFYGNIHLPWQTGGPPSPPTHSVDRIDRPPALPPNYFPHMGPHVSDLCRVCEDAVW